MLQLYIPHNYYFWDGFYNFFCNFFSSHSRSYAFNKSTEVFISEIPLHKVSTFVSILHEGKPCAAYKICT
jgi:hypothetical protein